MGPFEPCASMSPKSMRPSQRMDVLGPQTWAVSGAASGLKGLRGGGLGRPPAKPCGHVGRPPGHLSLWPRQARLAEARQPCRLLEKPATATCVSR